VLGAAIEHHDDTAHAVHVIAGLGWVCETCDDDWRECLAEYVNGGE
jgi:predicted HNH restriction endonuclease